MEPGTNIGRRHVAEIYLEFRNEGRKKSEGMQEANIEIRVNNIHQRETKSEFQQYK